MKRTLSSTRVLWATLPLLLFILGASSDRKIPVWYIGGEEARKNLPLEFQKPLHTFDGKDLLLTGENGTIRIRTCQEYLDAIQHGYGAPNNFENKHEVLFVTACFRLDYLKEAKPAVKSYFPDRALPVNLLNFLPPMIQAAAELDEDKNWRDQDRALRLRKFEGKRVSLEDDLSYYALTVDVAGDLNGDGIEDLAGSACQNVKQGTYMACKAFAVTRCGNNGPIILISEDGAPYSISSSTACNARPHASLGLPTQGFSYGSSDRVR